MKTFVFKLVLGIVISFSAFNLNAQNYEYIPLVKPGVQLWTDDFAYYTPDGIIYILHRYALTEEDTIIENETYKKLYLFTGNEFDSLTAQCIGGLRENEQKQVFYKGGSAGYTTPSGLICDFSLSVGDTFIIGEYQFPYTVEVKSIDTINYGGALRRVFIIGTTGALNMQIAAWVEGIGSVEGLLYNMYTKLMGMDFLGRNRCYEHNGILLYHDYPEEIDDCFTPVLSLNDIEEEDISINIYPNPTSKEVNISSESFINSIEVFNSLGQRIYQENIKSKEKTIDISSFSKGIFIIGVNTDKGYVRKKLIKD